MSTKDYQDVLQSLQNQEAEAMKVVGKAVQKRRLSPTKTSEEVGEHVVPKPREFTTIVDAMNFENQFRDKCAKKIELDDEIAKLTQQRSEVSQQIAKLVESDGIDALSKSGTSRVYFANPYKAQMRYTEVVGDIDLDAVRKHFPKMVVEETVSGKLDLQALQLNIKNIPGISLLESEQLKGAIEILRSAALKLNDKNIYQEYKTETVKDDLLILLNEGKVDPNIKKEIMGHQVKIVDAKTLRIESLVLTKHGRCGFCGYEKKASEAKDPHFVCPNCKQ